MRNLLGRLHARPAADLDRIAAWWRVPIRRGDRGGGIGALYRAMVGPIAARDAWARLEPDEARVLRALVDVPDHGATVPEIAAVLDRDPGHAREVAVRLYRHGLLAREGDEGELPLGELPRLVLPRELALLFRRVLDEIDLGDRSDTPLRALVEWLDDGEIDEAAAAWGVVAAPGTRQRSDLTRRLLRQIADPDRVARVVAALPGDARRIWEGLTTTPDRRSAPYAVAIARAGLADDDPASAARRRAALEDLERRLLVLHAYDADGERLLFVPAEVRDPRPAPSPPLPAVAALPDDAATAAARHPDAVAWDLLTLLRDIAVGGWPADEAPPRGRLRALNRRLWVAGQDAPPPGYVAFLLALARGEGLVAETGSDPATLAVSSVVRTWRELSFSAQSRRLRERWLAARERIEAVDRDEVAVWGVAWPNARARLLALLVDPAAGIDDGAWRPLDDAAARLAAREPDLLGAAFTAATARLAGEAGAGADREEARAAATADVVAGELATAFDWFGLVEVAVAPSIRGRVVRLTGTGRLLAHGGRPAEAGDGDAMAEPALTVADDGRVRLARPSPLRVWALSAFAEPVALRPEAVYALTEPALARAIEAGSELSQVEGFLVRQGAAPLPDAVSERLRTWARGVRRVRARRAVLLLPNDPADVEAIRGAARERGWPAEDHAAGVLVSLPPDLPDPDEAVLAALRSVGLSPRFDRPTASTPAPRVGRGPAGG